MIYFLQKGDKLIEELLFKALNQIKVSLLEEDVVQISFLLILLH